jgi:hypothetical protein
MSVIILTVDVKETRPASRLRDHHGPASEGIRHFTREASRPSDAAPRQHTPSARTSHLRSVGCPTTAWSRV